MCPPQGLVLLPEKAHLPVSICLNMIVKNESHVIRRCLSSVLPFISHWVIVDTGSTDGTQAIIQDFMKDVPGKLYERKWVDFAYNRNMALKLAKDKADFVLFIDADQILQVEADFEWPKFDKDSYSIREVDVDTSIIKVGLINNHLDWEWEGVIHEALKIYKNRTSARLKGIVLKSPHDGFRSQDPQKIHKDAKELEAALKKDPKNSRYQFYLALTYMLAKQYTLALKYFEKRIEMGGMQDEVFWSLLHVGIIQELQQMPEDIVIDSYFNAYKYDPSRAEPLYYIASHYARGHNYEGGYVFASQALLIPEPQDALFARRWIYEYGLRLMLLNCAFNIGKFEEAHQICAELLANSKLPPHIREQLLQNQGIISYKLSQAIPNTGLDQTS